jgi:hypothetical protein
MPAGGLVGRRLALGALRAAVDEAVAGLGGLVLLAGDAGMGKTALATEAVAYARGRGADTAWAACWEGDGAPGFWPWVQLLRTLAPEDGQALFGGRGGDAAGGGAGGLLGDEAAVRFGTFDATLRLLRERAARRPLVLVLDDLHWADVSSLRLLMFLARHVHDAPVLVVGTYREVEVRAAEEPARALLAELAGQAELVQLTGLTTDEVADLFHKTGGERPSAELARAVQERTAGNPFFVTQIARLISTQGASLEHVAMSGVPPAVGEVLARRLARLPTDVAALLGAAAVLGRRFSLATLAVVAALPAEQAVELLDVAVRNGIVEHDGAGSGRFSHDLFRQVCYERLGSSQTAALHLAAADALEQQTAPASAAEIAHHRLAASPVGDPRRTVAALVAAGREATARLAFDEAVVHWGRVVELEGGPEAADLNWVCEHADALRRVAKGDEAQAAFFSAAARAHAAGDAHALARAAFGAHRVATLTGSSRAAVIGILEQALGVLTGPAERQRWLILAALARELTDGPHADLPRAVTLAEAAVAGARAAGDDAALAYALFAVGDVRRAPGTERERLDIAEQLASAASAAGETELLLEARLAAVLALLELGDARYAEELAEFSRLAERAAIPRYVYLARSRQAMKATLTGPMELADRLIEEAAAYGERIGEPDTWGVQSSQLVGLALLRHDWTRLSALAAARGLALTPPEYVTHERAWLLVEAGDLAGAAAVVASLPQRRAIFRWRQAALYAVEAELVAAVGDRVRCAALYEQLLPSAGEFPFVASAVFTTGPIALQLGLLAAALGRRDDAVAHLQDAVTRCERLGAHLLAARARAELAAVTAGAEPAAGKNVLRQAGEVWTIGFAGRTAQVRDAKGIRDLAVLLAAPGREVAAADLAAGFSASASATGSLGADPVLDEQARAAYRARLAALDGELAAADAREDAARSARLSGERDALLGELARAAGLGGRPRRLGDVTERARSTVTARIRDAIGRIEQVHPELGRHLRASVSTGARCVYRPAETVRWTVSRT